MATVVGILDRDSWSARTDNIVVADPAAKTLTWVPRDLWCPALGDRINEAFCLAGFAGLFHALRVLGIQCDHGLVLRRSATEHAAAKISVEVPVTEPLDFLYPLAPLRPIEQGHKMISFRPPAERLENERLHQWVGARRGESPKSSDLDRITRQQVLLRALLEQPFDFKSVVAEPDLVRISAAAALAELASVESSWRMNAVADLRYETIDGKSVLVKRDEPLRPADTESPQLAVLVLALGAPSTAVETIRSLQAQDLAVEVVVVNSGGGGMAQKLARQGIDVTVLDREECLNPGAARNIGINVTTAPLLAFLAADSVVNPGWARRLVFVHQAGVAATGSALENPHPHNPIAWAGHFASWHRWVTASLRGGVSYERRLFDTYGLYRDDLPFGEEREFLARLPPELRPDPSVKIRVIRLNPTRLSELISQQYLLGAQVNGIRNDPANSACSFSLWRAPLERAWRACRNVKNRAAIFLALPLIPIALATYCLGGLAGHLAKSRDRRP